MLGIGGVARTTSIQLDKLAWITADIAVVALLFQDSSWFLKSISAAWPIYLWPAIAIISSVWSLEPGLSFYHGVQLLATLMVGSLLAKNYDIREIGELFFWALLMTMAASVAFVLIGFHGSRDPFGAWQGAFPHKNNLGGAMVVLVALTPALMGRGKLNTCVALIAIVSGTGVTLLSKSGTAIFTLLVVYLLIIFALMFSSIRRNPGVYLALFSLLAISSLLAIEISGIDLTDFLLSALGKDRTLSGRTVLWYYGWLTFEDHPYLGIGYKAYMASDQTSSSIVQYILQQRLPYLHNNYLEVAVAFGFFGFVPFVMGLCFSIWCAIKLLIRDNLRGAWPLCFMVNVLIVMSTENPLFYNHSITQVIWMSICCAAMLERGSASYPIAAKRQAQTSPQPYIGGEGMHTI